MLMIDLQTWSRREHFMKFNSFDHPHFGMCANVDLSSFYQAVKQQNHSIRVAIVYVLSRAANTIPEFRYRIREGKVVEHDIVHPSITLQTERDLFSFCMMEFKDDYAEFAARHRSG